MNPVKASLNHPQVTLVLTAALFAAGIHAILTMPRREDPKITIRSGLVAAVYPGASAEQVEKQLTKKVEEKLFRFAEVRKSKTFSTSRPGLMIINVHLEDGVRQPDRFWSKLRHDLNELRARELPDGVLGPVVDSDFGDTVAVMVAVHGEAYGYRELKDYVERIESMIRTVPAVSRIRRFGEQREQIQVTSTPERIARYGVTALEVSAALRARNAVRSAGSFDAGRNKVRLDASGLFQTQSELRRTMVGLTPQGRPIYLGDLTRVERRYQDPEFLTRHRGLPCLIFSVEMQEGHNIVEFGHQLQRKLDEARRLLPPDLKLDVVANQPGVVEERIGHFLREFGIAIAAVILVTMLLLPPRVAAIAALAIPVTVAVTFAAMKALGIELHQVSISALIVVLGMVVDDAIVIADNYVELLDRGMPRAEAAWRSATDLAVPVLTATLTIVASFLPLLLVSGSVGEFIFALPVTVAIALAVSFLVAMLLTPLLSRFFIRKGLHSGAAAAGGRTRFSVLEAMRRLYDHAIRAAMAHRTATLTAAAVSFLAGIALLHAIPERFFPSAERDQFVIDVWMPEGTRIEATSEVLRRLEERLGATPGVRNHTTFAGRSAPRFYYNVDPQQPASNYGQMLVNTESPQKTVELVRQLRRTLPAAAPEALILIRELEQGEVLSAPIEVRIRGGELAELKQAAAAVERILRDTPGAEYVYNDFREDAYKLRVDVRHQLASRLGFTSTSIALQLHGSFSGLPVSTYWEGDRAVDIELRLDAANRSSLDQIRDTYLISTLTGARVPLREIADLRPAWETSRIVRRNGVRTITVRAHPQHGVLASELLRRARPALEAVELPPGYRMEYGGELESQAETFREMMGALAVSLGAIFLILLLQFRSLTDPLVVMVSIPLAVFGAALGLLLTGNPFGFTAFLGLVSLSGIVVRNAIILVDCIHERMREGVDLHTAALEAGRRRLRPIFLTSAAAAVGVVPMIASGSSLWSPLASVIAVGLLCSMVFTLLVVPVLFVMSHRSQAVRAA